VGLLDQRSCDVTVVACPELGCASCTGGGPQDVADLRGFGQRME